jgi:hypothetical protein
VRICVVPRRVVFYTLKTTKDSIVLEVRSAVHLLVHFPPSVPKGTHFLDLVYFLPIPTVARCTAPKVLQKVHFT